MIEFIRDINALNLNITHKGLKADVLINITTPDYKEITHSPIGIIRKTQHLSNNIQSAITKDSSTKSVVTNGGGLNCKYIIHIIPDKVDLSSGKALAHTYYTFESLITSALLQTLNLPNVKSVAIPYMSLTGLGNINSQASVIGMLNGLRDFFLSYPESNIEEIYIVDDNSDNYNILMLTLIYMDLITVIKEEEEYKILGSGVDNYMSEEESLFGVNFLEFGSEPHNYDNEDLETFGGIEVLEDSDFDSDSKQIFGGKLMDKEKNNNKKVNKFINSEKIDELLEFIEVEDSEALETDISIDKKTLAVKHITDSLLMGDLEGYEIFINKSKDSKRITINIEL